MILIPLYAPCTLALDEADQDRAIIQYGGPGERCFLEGVSGWFVRQQLYQMTHERLTGFQHGPFACDANESALICLRAARHYASRKHGAIQTNPSDALPHALDGVDPTIGAAHLYLLPRDSGGDPPQRVQYQHGPRGFPDSVPGVFDDAILAILHETAERSRERRYLRAARNVLALRVARRMERGVAGTHRL